MSKGREAAAGGAAAVLLRYLREQNRPYSAQDAFGNLQREHGLGKAAVVKALEQLAQQGRVREKVYGKQKIYFADQVTAGCHPGGLSQEQEAILCKYRRWVVPAAPEAEPEPVLICSGPCRRRLG
uniref:Homologous-pairing protein 2 homolog n=1 Tax=Geospiza parvula TaxID=87175 RepID=A0A8U8C2R5_GEOPR